MKQINCSIDGKATDTPRVRFDSGRFVIGQFENPQRVIFKLADDVTGGGDILYEDRSVRVVAPPDTDPVQEGPRLSYLPLTPRIVVSPDKRSFQTVDGEKWVWAMATDFALFHKFLTGQDIDPILDQRLAAGANGVRVLGMAYSLFNLQPGDYTATDLSEFASYLSKRGLYLEFVAFADAQNFSVDQQTHWIRINEALMSEPNVFIELANEYRKNGVDPSRFNRYGSTVLQARGSGLSDEPPASPAWDYSTFHPRRDWKWPFTCAATINEIYQQSGLGGAPIVVNEPIGAADANEPGRRSCDAGLFEKMALECKLWGGGATFHSEAGLQSDLWSPTQEECARAFYRGLGR